MRGMLLVLVLASLLFTPRTSLACPSGSHGNWLPATLFEHCLERDMKAGLVQHVTVTERDVRWFVRASPEIRVERIRLAASEIARLTRLSSIYSGCPARQFTMTVSRSQRATPSLAAQLAPSLGLLAFTLGLLLVCIRRSRSRVRVLTRQVERREAWILACTTVAVAAFIWATWPDRQTSTVERLEHRMRANLVHDVTFTGSTVTWKEVGRRTAYSATIPGGEGDANKLYKTIRTAVVHTRNPEQPNEVLHRVNVRRDNRGPVSGFGLIPWLVAGMFWCAWVRMIRRSCCW